MFVYYFRLGLRSLRRNPVLTALMVLGIALGIGTSMTTLTVLHLMGSDPIPWKSARLHTVQMDSWNPNAAFAQPAEPPTQLTYRDANALMQAARGDRQAAMFRVALPVQSDNHALKPRLVTARATYTDFFAMFEPPFEYGGPWNRAHDDAHARVLVLSKATNEELFGGVDSVGKHLLIGGLDYSVIGVLAQWRPSVRFYDVVSSSAFDDPEEIYLPYTTAVETNTGTIGGQSVCWGNVPAGREAYLASECVWQQFWVELDSPAKLAAYRSFLEAYVGEQKKLGRFPRPLDVRLPDVNEWLTSQKIVSSDVQIQAWLAFAFLGVCLVSTIGLLLAKFLRKSGEIGVRRALGASRGQVFAQHLMEAAVIGCSGGVLGLLFAWLGLLLVRGLDPDLQAVARLDWPMVATAIVLSVLASTMAGLYPTWSACRVQPAVQLKI
jgi:putative ABC transport system permease protein